MSARRHRLFALLIASAALPASALELNRITPLGDEAPASSQIVLGFDRAMVPLGRMERRSDEVPVTITPDPACRWRWLDAQHLACTPADNAGLRAATAYRVAIGAGFTALDGSVLAAPPVHHFNTETAKLEYAHVTEWRGPGEPILRAWFSQPVDAASIAVALHFDGTPVIAEAEPDDLALPFYTPRGEARSAWRLRPARPLPTDRSVALRLRAGLRSAFGPATGRETREVLRVQGFAAPRVLGLECTVGGERRRVDDASRCAPLEGVSLIFNTPVSAEALAAHLALTPKTPVITVPPADGEAGPRRPRAIAGHLQGQQPFLLALPFALAAETAYRMQIGEGLRDRFGRPFTVRPALRFATGSRTPRLVLDHSPAVLEAGIDSEVPVIVTELSAIAARFRALQAGGVTAEQQVERSVPAVRNLAFAMPLGVREMLGGRSGALLGELQPSPPVSRPARAQPFFAAVTPWQVHAKLGHSDTLVWITAFADGQPVRDAEVAVLDGFGTTVLAQTRSDAQGLAALPGSATLDPKLERQYLGLHERSRDGKSPPPQPLMLRVTRGDETALLPLSGEFEVDTWRASREQIWASRLQRHGHLRSWGSSAQGVYRGGDTVQYKLYVRDESGRTLQPAPAGSYTLKVIDPLGRAVHEREAVKLSAFGAIDGAFKLASGAAVGWYRFELTPSYRQEQQLEPLRVLVSDFVPAPFRVTSELRAARITPDQPVIAAVQATLHSGGAFAQAPAALNARLQASSLQFDTPLASRYRYDSVQRGVRDGEVLFTREARLDAAGEWSETIRVADNPVVAGELVFEASVQDDRGRGISAASRAPYFGRDRYIGLQQDGWLQAGKSAQLQTLVVDAKGQPLEGVPYYVKIERKVTKGARVKGAGNAYITRYTSRWVRVATCKGRSSGAGDTCAFTPDAGGELRAIAMVRDSANRLHETSSWMYAQGANAVLWEDRPDFALDLRLDKTQYRVGDTAKLFVQNPFPGATALITVERYGVLERRVEVLKSATPVIALKIRPEFLPGAYVSVVLQSPRVAAPIKDGVDLGKPSFRMGYATLKVDDPYRALEVRVTPGTRTAKPRETVEVALQATPRQASGEPVEFAVAVLDEAVFDLIAGGRAYFDPQAGFTQLDALDLANYSLLTRLVGRQKFEKKGASPGGDGGSELSLRAVEQFVAYWNPALKADAQGRAQFRFTTPDNLSGWRVLAMAVTPGDRMGLGEASVAVTRPTELRALLPERLQRGDVLDARFSLMNRADKARTLEVKLAARGAAQAERRLGLTLQPFERRVLTLPLSLTAAGTVTLIAEAGDAQDRDALQQSLQVRERPPTLTAASFAALDAGDSLNVPLRVPDTALAASLRVDFTTSLLGSLDGAFRYFADYPYLCWEQRLSKAVMAAHFLKLQPRLADAPDWPQAAALPQATLDDAAGFQAPNGGMSFFQPRDEYHSPWLSAYTALAFGWLQQLGYAPPATVWDRLDAYLLQLLREDITREAYASAESRAQLRALVLAALAQRGRIDAAELARYRNQLERMGLFGEALYAEAAQRTTGAEALARTATDRLLARSERSAAGLLLTEHNAGDEAWLLGSTLRSNCAALSALLAADRPDSEILIRLTRAITQARGTRTHWANTQENLWCTRALITYADRYEATPPSLQAELKLDARVLQTLSVQHRGAMHEQALGKQAAGRDSTLSISTRGSGRTYALTTLRYATPPPQTALAAGLSLSRRHFVRRGEQWQPLEGTPLVVRQGDLLKIELLLEVPAWMSYVVVDDPVPAGLEPLNPDLATTAGFAADEIAQAGPAYPYPFYHRELRFDAVRHYAEALPAGRYKLAWIGQAVASGEFAVGEPHAERMYDPDVFGNGVAARLRVEAAP